MVVMGENPAMSAGPRTRSGPAAALRAPGGAGPLPHTERRRRGRRGAAGLGFAEDQLATGRTVQRSAAPPSRRPGEARQDLWITRSWRAHLGLGWNYAGPQEVFEEMRDAMPSIAGISGNRLERDGCGDLSLSRRGGDEASR